MNTAIKIYPPKPEQVYLFGTCLVDLFYPEAGMAGVKLLEREGVRVHYPQDQTCCGQPAYTSGRTDDARAVATHQLGLFQQPWPIVVPSGSCAGMMRKHYPRLFAGTEHEALANDIASRVYELSEFLLHVCRLSLTDLGAPVDVALHTSCSSRREMATAEVGPALLAQLSNVTLVEQARSAECCGFGGAFSVRHPDVSGAMVHDKVSALRDTGATRFVATDIGCLMNIQGHADTQPAGLQGEHLLSFLWQRSTPGEGSS
ncbi:MAG: (Fe-S)-binding protein [Saccharospirillum sp.]